MRAGSGPNIPSTTSHAHPGTADAGYAQRLRRLQDARWKRWLGAQAPYRWHVRRLGLGRVLDLGCGIGRNLAHLDGHGVGIDHNPDAVRIARSRGLVAFDSAAWPHAREAEDGAFDAMLVAHVLEHMGEQEGVDLVGAHLRYVKAGGKVVFITPQERGYESDATHARFVGFAELALFSSRLALVPVVERSFPFPRPIGRVFTYNEFVVVVGKL